jgi:uncharacterized repeat protein (TIGR01451 family)
VTIINAEMSYDASLTPSVLGPAALAVLRLTFTNSGQGLASGVWVNVTLPPELNYVSDDAAAIGGTRSGSFSFEFLAVAPGSYVFNVTSEAEGGEAEGGVTNGTVATTNVTFEARDLGGVALNETARDLDVTFGNAVLSLTVVTSAVVAQPGDTIVLNATVRNLGTEAAENLRIQASVDANATYLRSTPSGTYDPVDRDVDWDLGTLAEGGVTSVEWEIAVPVGAPDGSFVRSLVRAEADDPSGVRLPREEDQSLTRVAAPNFAPALRLSRALAERNDTVLASFFYNNTGSITSPRAWINLTLGGHYEVLALNPDLPFTPTASGFSVEVDNVTVAGHLLEVELLVVRGLEDGLFMELQVQWTSTDGDGNVLAPQNQTASVELLAPSVTITLGSSASKVTGGSVFTLNLALENVGRADAFGWVNLTLPAGATFQGDNNLLDVTTQDNQVTWTLNGMQGGTNLTLSVEVQAGGDPGPRPISFALALTDGRGSPAALFASNEVSVEFLAPPSPFANVPWWLLLLVALVGLAASGIWAVRRRGGAGDLSVEEVFVVDRGGTLLGHRSNSILQYKDEDLVVAMLTAIQRYIEDVFSYGIGDTIRSLEFGERRILIEDGASHFVAIVYRGEDAAQLRDRARGLCAQIDERFGKIIDDWNGDTDEVRGIAALLPLIWRKRGHQRV